jgi:hypothetical protein
LLLGLFVVTFFVRLGGRPVLVGGVLERRRRVEVWLNGWMCQCRFSDLIPRLRAIFSLSSSTRDNFAASSATASSSMMIRR